MIMCYFFFIWPILQARGEIKTIFSLLFFGRIEAKENCFWDFLTFNKVPDIRVNPEPTDPNNPKDISAILATEVAEGPKIWGARYE